MWNKVGDILKTMNSEQGSSKFVKLDDGETIEGVIRGEPVFFWNNFDKKDTQPYVLGKSRPGKGYIFRFRVNFIVKTDAGYSAKILEHGSRMLNTLEDIRDEDGFDNVFRIKRLGKGTDTTYTIKLKKALTDEEKAIYNDIPLNDLSLTKGEEDDVPF